MSDKNPLLQPSASDGDQPPSVDSPQRQPRDSFSAVGPGLGAALPPPLTAAHTHRVGADDTAATTPAESAAGAGGGSGAASSSNASPRATATAGIISPTGLISPTSILKDNRRSPRHSRTQSDDAPFAVSPSASSTGLLAGDDAPSQSGSATGPFSKDPVDVANAAPMPPSALKSSEEPSRHKRRQTMLRDAQGRMAPIGRRRVSIAGSQGRDSISRASVSDSSVAVITPSAAPNFNVGMRRMSHVGSQAGSRFSLTGIERAQSFGPAGSVRQSIDNRASMGGQLLQDMGLSMRGMAPPGGGSGSNDQSGAEEDYAITSAEYEQIQRMFDQYDRNRDGTIDAFELRELMLSLGHQLTDHQLTELIFEVTGDRRRTALHLDELVKLILFWKDAARFRLFERETAPATQHIHAVTYVGWSLFLPECRTRRVWDTLMAGVIAAVVLSTSFFYCFDDDSQRDEYRNILLGPEIILSILCALDVVMWFCTTGTDGRKLVTDRWIIAKNYIVSPWLWIDLIAIIPFWVFVPMDIAQWFQWVRAVKAARYLTLFESSGRVPMDPAFVTFYFKFLPILQGAVFMVIFVHGCAVIMIYQQGGRLYDLSYTSGIYYALLLISGVGSAVVPGTVDTTAKRWYSSFVMLCGQLINALFVGGLVNYFQISDIAGVREHKLAEMSAVCKYFKIPEALSNELLQFQDHVLSHNLTVSYFDLIKGLPREMKVHVGIYARIRLVNRHPLFIDAHEAVHMALAQALEPIVFCPEEYVILADDIDNDMFIVAHGFLDVLSKKSGYVRTLKPMDHFCEPSLFGEVRHQYNIKALTYAELYALSSDKFQQVQQRFPAFKAHTTRIMDALRRRVRPKKQWSFSPTRDVSDIAMLPGEKAAIPPSRRWTTVSHATSALQAFADSTKTRSSEQTEAGRGSESRPSATSESTGADPDEKLVRGLGSGRRAAHRKMLVNRSDTDTAMDDTDDGSSNATDGAVARWAQRKSFQSDFTADTPAEQSPEGAAPQHPATPPQSAAGPGPSKEDGEQSTTAGSALDVASSRLQVQGGAVRNLSRRSSGAGPLKRNLSRMSAAMLTEDGKVLDSKLAGMREGAMISFDLDEEKDKQQALDVDSADDEKEMDGSDRDDAIVIPSPVIALGRAGIDERKRRGRQFDFVSANARRSGVGRRRVQTGFSGSPGSSQSDVSESSRGDFASFHNVGSSASMVAVNQSSVVQQISTGTFHAMQAQHWANVNTAGMTGPALEPGQGLVSMEQPRLPSRRQTPVRRANESPPPQLAAVVTPLLHSPQTPPNLSVATALPPNHVDAPEDVPSTTDGEDHSVRSATSGAPSPSSANDGRAAGHGPYHGVTQAPALLRVAETDLQASLTQPIGPMPTSMQRNYVGGLSGPEDSNQSTQELDSGGNPAFRTSTPQLMNPPGPNSALSSFAGGAGGGAVGGHPPGMVRRSPPPPSANLSGAAFGISIDAASSRSSGSAFQHAPLSVPGGTQSQHSAAPSTRFGFPSHNPSNSSLPPQVGFLACPMPAGQPASGYLSAECLELMAHIERAQREVDNLTHQVYRLSGAGGSGQTSNFAASSNASPNGRNIASFPPSSIASFSQRQGSPPRSSPGSPPRSPRNQGQATPVLNSPSHSPPAMNVMNFSQSDCAGLTIGLSGAYPAPSQRGSPSSPIVITRPDDVAPFAAALDDMEPDGSSGAFAASISVTRPSGELVAAEVAAAIQKQQARLGVNTWQRGGNGGGPADDDDAEVATQRPAPSEMSDLSRRPSVATRRASDGSPGDNALLEAEERDELLDVSGVTKSDGTHSVTMRPDLADPVDPAAAHAEDTAELFGAVPSFSTFHANA